MVGNFYIFLCIILKICPQKKEKKLILTLKSYTRAKRNIGQVVGITLYLIEYVLKDTFAY